MLLGTSTLLPMIVLLISYSLSMMMVAAMTIFIDRFWNLLISTSNLLTEDACSKHSNFGPFWPVMLPRADTRHHDIQSQEASPREHFSEEHLATLAGSPSMESVHRHPHDPALRGAPVTITAWLPSDLGASSHIRLWDVLT